MVDLIKACTATLHSQHYLVMMLKDHFVFKKTDSGEYEKKRKRGEKNISHCIGWKCFLKKHYYIILFKNQKLDCRVNILLLNGI